MWRCSHCHEPLDDVFTVCWKCGTAADGSRDPDFRPESADAWDAHPSVELEPIEPEEETDNDASLPEPDWGRIVELCSAANVAEAYGWQKWLEEAGIPARVVGEQMANTLALGEVVAPRIWVHEADAARARSVLAERIRQLAEDEDEAAPDDEDWDEENAAGAEPLRAEPVEPPERAHFATATPVAAGGGAAWRPRSSGLSHWLGLAALLAGIVLGVGGIVWAGVNRMAMQKYSAAAQGVQTASRFQWDGQRLPPPEIPFERQSRVQTQSWFDVEYAYVVGGKMYSVTVREVKRPPARVTVHYSPQDPGAAVVGDWMPPWLILAWALPVGGILTLAGLMLCAGADKDYGP